MQFPDELWRLIMIYFGPNSASLELVCRQAGIHFGEWLKSRVNLRLFYYRYTIATEADFVLLLRRRSLIGVTKVSRVAKSKARPGMVDVYFYGIMDRGEYIRRAMSGVYQDIVG